MPLKRVLRGVQAALTPEVVSWPPRRFKGLRNELWGKNEK